MSESKTDLQSKVKNWLMGSGYPLEMYAHEKLIDCDFYCEKSALYTDIESDAEREIDIVARRGFGSSDDSHYFMIELLVECKKSKNPFVVLSTGSECASVYDELMGARTEKRDRSIFEAG